jgi:hypothetical protein
MWSIKTAENEIVDIVADYGGAEEYVMFLNEVADIDGSNHYVVTETTEADVTELALQEQE